MLNVLFISNPFNFELDGGNVQRFQMPNGLSVRDILELWQPGFIEFEFPTICLVNGEPVLRKDWTAIVPNNSSVSFVRLAGGWVAVIIAVVVVVAAIVAVAVVMVQKQNPAAIGASPAEAGQQKNGGDTVYSLSGERNQNKLNNVIEAAYGRNRMFPAYAARPYNVYAGNQQFQFSLFCIGHGWYDIEKMLFEDTPLHNFQDVEFEVVNPGETFDLFHDDVITSSEVQGIELFGTNEPEFRGPTPAFVTNPPFTKASLLEFDVSFPNGLYELDDEGKPDTQAIQVQFFYLAIDDTGAAKGTWKPLPLLVRHINPTVATSANKKTNVTETTIPYFLKEMATLTPQRFTLQARVPAGRYMVKAQRVNDREKSAQAANQVQWDAMRAFLPPVKTYGDVTLVAVKARASNNLNNNAAQKFNVIATRKLHKWTQEHGWSALTVTRNPVWAFCDVFKANYGGRLPDQFLDLAALKKLADTYDAEGITFDYIFDQRTTVWEAARAIALVGRGVPMLNGSRLYIVRDTLRTSATAVFNQYNIVAESLNWQIALRPIQDYDGVEVEYVDADTWKQETVLCLIDENDLGEHPESLKLSGCTNRTRAFQEGLYRRAVELFQREVIEFKTGVEGYLPRYGDLILVAHDVPRWGTGGLVTSIEGGKVNLTEPVTFLPGITHRIVLRKRDGSAFGPVTALPGDNERQVVISLPEGNFRAFDYAVIRYHWTPEGGDDLDTRTAILELDPSVDGQDVGWGGSRHTTVEGASGPYLTWNGDNTDAGVEAVLIDCKRLVQDFPDKETCKFRLRANWYAERGTGDMSVTFTTYKGGTMAQEGFDFVNTGGTLVDEVTLPFNVTAFQAADVDGEDLTSLNYNLTTGIGHVGDTPPTTDQGLKLEDFIFDTNHELPYFLFGQEQMEFKRCVVTGITPEAEDIITIRAVNYDERIYSYAGVPTPQLGSAPTRVTDPDRPVVARVDVMPIPGSTDRLLVSWPPALGARSYVVETSPDGIDWTRLFAQPTTSTELRVTSTSLYLRVAGVNVDIGPYAYWNGTPGIDFSNVPAQVANVHLVASGPGFVTIGWNALANVDSYQVNIYEDVSSRLLRRATATSTSYTYTADFGDIDELVGQAVKFLVLGHNLKGVSNGGNYFHAVIPERIDPTETADKTTTQTDKTVVTADTY
jgi:Putative phage tail protein